MILLDLFNTQYKNTLKESVAEGVEIIDQDSDLDQEIYILNVDGNKISFTYWDYENNFQNPDIKDIYQQAKEQLARKLSPEQIKDVARAVFKSFKQGVAEGSLEANTPDPVIVIQDKKGKILDKMNLSVATKKYKLGNPQDVKQQLAHQSYTTIGNYVVASPMSGQPQDNITQSVKEELKGNQYKLDKNKNGKIDKQDFELLRKLDTKEDSTPGWMLEKDPELAKKIETKKKAYKDLIKYAGKKIEKRDSKQTRESVTEDLDSLKSKLESLKLRQKFQRYYADHGGVSPKRQNQIKARIRELEQQIKDHKAKANNAEDQDVTEGLRVDVPNEDWLADKIEYAKSKGRDSYGVPRSASITATARHVRVPVAILKTLPGMKGEQSKVRHADLDAIVKIMQDTGKLPLVKSGNEYEPFINVFWNGEAWVNEGNHRIMAAAKLGWKDLPVEISYFDGGERIRSGAMYPGRIGLGEPVNELSTEKLAQYKTAAAADASAADKRGDYKRGDKRFGGIVKATNKQFANDVKKHNRDTVKEESGTGSDAVESAVLNRIMIAHKDLLQRFGPDQVMQAVEEVAYGAGDVDEIGTSDVSAYVRQVRQILGAK